MFISKPFILTLIACAVTIPNIVHANDFDIERIGDLLMVITPAYALGMTSRENNFDGTIQFIKSFAATQLVTEGIKGF